MSRATTFFYCPFCGEQDLRPEPDPTDAWTCRACTRTFSVDLTRATTPEGGHR